MVRLRELEKIVESKTYEVEKVSLCICGDYLKQKKKA